MGYEYALLAAAIIIPLGLFSILKGDPSDPAFAAQKNSLPGAFGGDNSSKAKKKKPKKKKSSNGANEAAHASDDSEPEEVPVAITSAKKSDFQTVSSKKNKGKGNKNSISSNGSAGSAQASSLTTAAPATSASLSASVTTTSTKGSSKTTNNNTSTSSSAPLTSIEKYRQQKLDQHKQQLAQQEPLKFAQAASQNTHQSPSSPNVVSIPGPGAMGNNKKKNNRSGAAGSGLSHAEFPSLARPEPAKAAPKEPKAPKQKKPKEVIVAPPAPVPKKEPAVSSDEEEQEEEPVLSESEHEMEPEQEQEQEEWTTVASNPSRSGGIDFSKPMDPWVAQQQKQKLERIAAADPHGEQDTQYARVLSIKPTVKEQAIREAIPDGFSTQKSRSSGASSGSRQYQSEEVSKKQRENLAKAAKKKEEKAAQDAIQEQRLKEHMRQVKAEKMKEFYKAQTRKSAPVESRWNAPKQPQQPSSSAVSGGMSAQVNEKGQLIWD
ncbi:hypothetical protein CPB97_005347 [Podila verticillata]|nr:hypothetical protein CPB97_005347 [Podila verticillata]